MQWQLRHDSSAVRALVRITRGPGFDPQLCCLNFSAFPCRCQCFLLIGEKRMVNLMYLSRSGSAFPRCKICCKSVHQITTHGVGCCWLWTATWQSPNSEALTLVDGEVDYSVQWRLRHDSSAVRALVRITRGPGFDPQLRCLNFFRFSVPMSVLSFYR